MKKIKQNLIKNLVGGFTLIETMVSIFILTFIVVGLLGIVSTNLFNARYSKNEIIANYLLQEAVDYIRNHRDSEVHQQDIKWDVFFSKYSRCSGTYGCYIDITKENYISSCSSDTCPYFYYKDNADDYFYSYDFNQGVLTNFKRTIKVKKNDDNEDEINILVTMEWKNGNLSRSKSLHTSLLNWEK